MVFQCFRSLILIATILAFELFHFGMNDQVHLQCTFRIQLQSAVWTNVIGVFVDVFVDTESCLIFETLRTMWTLNGKLGAVCQLMFFQATFGHETFTTFFTDERTIAGMDGPNMCLYIDNFAKTLITELARMHIFQFVRQMHQFVDVQFFQCVKAFRTLAAAEYFFQCRMALSHVYIELTLFLKILVTYRTPATNGLFSELFGHFIDVRMM